MQLQHIELDQLKITNLNVRKKGAKSVDDLLPSIRSLGIVQPLLVRKNCEGYDIIAGQRRYHAAIKLVTEEDNKHVNPAPCIIMEDGDDAKAIEASLAENIARLPMDEIDQYKAFAALVQQGQDIEDIAAQFGVTERLVKQRLAIANLLPPILTLYRKGKIHAQTIRTLTRATKKQQKAWLELWRSDEGAPEGHLLKNWLFGGEQIPVSAALFDVEDYGDGIVSDLFGDEACFDDAEKFWNLQNTAIANAKDAYLEEGWQDVIICERGEYFYSYEFVDTPKNKGGKVYVVSANNGEVTFYEGKLSRKEAKAKEKAKTTGVEDTDAVNTKPEITKPMQNYLNLHRHAAVRCELLSHQGVALRLAVAQIIAGAGLLNATADPQYTKNEATKESLAENKAEAIFSQERERVLTLLGMNGHNNDTLVPRKGEWDKHHNIHDVFSKLLELDDANVSLILTFVVAETLESGSLLAEALGRVDELPHVYFAGFAPRKFDGSTLIFDSMEDLDVDEDERTRLGTCIGSISGLPPVCWCEGKE